MKKLAACLVGGIMLVSCVSGTDRKEAEMNHFVDDLMNKMTLEEKVGQLNLVSVGFDVTGPILSENVEEKIKAGQVGGVFNTFTPDAVRKLQNIAVNETRLGIPLLFGYDVIHGHKTIFPVPLGLSASWDMDLIGRVARASADEASADGVNWIYSPMVDIVRDPRWGRVSESNGEDPYLSSCIARTMVENFQLDDLSKENTVMACLKHFALYGASEAGRDYNTVDMSRIRMYNEYLPPYKAAVEAGVGSVMTSFNEIDGIPATANRWLLTDLLRRDWGFEGFVVTDYTATMELLHHGMGDKAKVSELALNAGTDMDMVSEYFLETGIELVKSGRVSEAVVDAACRRILQAKYKLGLFDDPYKYVNEERAASDIGSDDKLALAKEAAAKSMVLLKNDRQVLPLDSVRKVAFIGPHVKGRRDLIGNWSAAGDWRKAVTVWEGIENTVGTANCLYAQGCNILEDETLIDKLNPHGAMIEKKVSADRLLAEAVRTAHLADVVVAVLGETFGMSGEAASRSDISLPDNQRELLKALKATGKPIVLVLMNGRPLTLEWEDSAMDAILETWFAGTRAGDAIAEVLYGEATPSGKLSMTFPRNVGQIPLYYNHKNTGRPFLDGQKYTTKYLDIPNEPLYPFGHGLSYTTFAYCDINMSGNTLSGNNGKLTASVIVTNTGQRTGVETVQLYLRDMVGSVTRPVKELKDFQKVLLNPGESKQVNFDITVDQLKFYNSDLQYVAEPGEFQIFIGGSSADVKSASFVYENK
jgi:beta-glucosidase